MKRLALASTLVSVAVVYTACGSEVTPPSNTSGGAQNTSGGMAPTSGGVAPTSGGMTTTSGGMTTTSGGMTTTSGGTGNGGGGTTSSGGSSSGGKANSGGTTNSGGASSGGKANSGGTTNSGGASSGGGGAGGGGGGGDDSATVATMLHGHTILMPCAASTSGRVCTPRADNTRPCTNPTGGPASSYQGTHSHNEQITLGGTPGVRYIVRLRIQGEVEAKTYTGGMDANNASALPANGLYTGGSANNSGDAYNVYFIRTDSPAQHFYLNSVGTATSSRVEHTTFPMDYEFDIEVEGGSKVCMVSADPNNSAIKNCAPPDNGSECKDNNTITVANLNPLTLADITSQPYNGQFIGITVVSARKK